MAPILSGPLRMGAAEDVGRSREHLEGLAGAGRGGGGAQGCSEGSRGLRSSRGPAGGLLIVLRG